MARLPLTTALSGSKPLMLAGIVQTPTHSRNSLSAARSQRSHDSTQYPRSTDQALKYYHKFSKVVSVLDSTSSGRACTGTMFQAEYDWLDAQEEWPLLVVVPALRVCSGAREVAAKAGNSTRWFVCLMPDCDLSMPELDTDFQEEWPLLIIVPASLRLVWAEELEKWLPRLRPSSIHVIEGKTDRLQGSNLPDVCITSYEMMQRLTCDACKGMNGKPVEPSACAGSQVTSSA